jgi:hypothetical protein
MDANASHWMVVLAKSLYTVHGSNETQNAMATFTLVWLRLIKFAVGGSSVLYFVLPSLKFIIQNIFLQ